MNKQFIFICLVSGILFSASVKSQINIDFKSASDLSSWTGNQGTLSLTSNEYLCLTATSTFWANANYTTANGMTWDFDNNKVIVVKYKEKKGDNFIKIRTTTGVDRKLVDSQPTPIPSSTNVIHMFAFEDNPTYTELQSGSKTLASFQLGNENVSSTAPDLIQVDWIKTFATKALANQYIAEISKIDIDFNSSADLINWTGSSATVAQSNSNLVLTLNTTNGYGIAKYGHPNFGVKWNIDLYKAFVIKTTNTGNLTIKFRNSANTSDYTYTTTPTAIPNSTNELQAFAFEDKAATYPELQSGIVKFYNMQLAYDGSLPNGTIENIDFIKAFTTKAEAIAFVSSYINPTITFVTPTSVSKTYGDANFTNAVSSNSAGAITYSSGTTSVATVNATTGEVTIVGAGSSIITVSQVSSGQYNAGTKTYTLTVEKANSTISPTIGTYVYNSSTQGPNTVTKTGSSGIVTYSYTGVNETSYTASSTPPINAGSYTVSASVAADANYNAASSSATAFTITKAILTVSNPSATNKQYDGNNIASITGSLSGIINSDDVTLNGTGTFASSAVGTGIAVTSTSTLGGTKAENYTLTQPAGLNANITAISAPVNSNSNLGNASSLAGTNVTVAANTELTVNSTATVLSLSLAPGAKLNIGTGNTLTATNGITLQSDATGTATILNSGTYTGTVTAQQYLGSARNWYLSSPVQITNSPTNNIARFYEYVEAGNNNYPVDGSNNPVNVGETSYWKYWAPDNSMTMGKGYIAQATSGTTVQFSGTPNNGNITTTFNLTRNDLKGKGFNLVGNPYPSYIDWSLVAQANTNLMSTAWFKTKKTDVAGGGYTFASVNVTTPSSPEIVSNNANTTITKYIPPTQAFWVRVKNGTSSTSMSFTNAMREHRLDNGDLMKAPKVNERSRLRLQLANGIESDETLIYFDKIATNDFNEYDSPKMMNNSTVTPDLYTKAGIERLVINGMNAIADNMELPLGFSLNAAAELKLKATEMSNFPLGTRIYLLDKVESTQTELTPETEYSFSTSAAIINNESRFSLLFRVPGSTTDINNMSKLNALVFVNAANQITIVAPEQSNYAIYNAMGQLIENGISNSKLQTINCKLYSGIYTVKVNNSVTKVIIR